MKFAFIKPKLIDPPNKNHPPKTECDVKTNSLWKKEEQIFFYTWSRPDIKPTLGEWEQDQRPENNDTIQKKHKFWNRRWFEEGR